MHVFLEPRFQAPEYDGTLFKQLTIVDERHPESIKQHPIPALDRVVVYGPRIEKAVSVRFCLDGSPDLRFNPVGWVDDRPWAHLPTLLHGLEKARLLGDAFELKTNPQFPIAMAKWPSNGDFVDAIMLTSIQGFSGYPLYFRGQFVSFSDAVNCLLEIEAKINAGLLRSEMHTSTRSRHPEPERSSR